MSRSDRVFLPVTVAMFTLVSIGGLVYERVWQHNDTVFWLCVAYLVGMTVLLFGMIPELGDDQ